MMQKLPLRVALLVLVSVVTLVPAHAERKRNALVIGVSDYSSDDFKDLPRPHGDATAMACRLADDYGYTVTRLLSAHPGVREEPCQSPLAAAELPTVGTIRRVWEEMVAKLSDDEVITVFFAGHGIELKGRTFLLPSDADKSGETDDSTGRLTFSSVDFNWMLEVLAKQQQQHSGIVGVFIIDACRENPFTFSEAKDAEPVGLNGGPVPTSEIFVMYSSGIGQLAADGADGLAHSPFATALFDELNKESRRHVANPTKPQALSGLAQSIKLAFYEATVKAGKAVKQTPSYYNQLEYSRLMDGGRAEPIKIIPRPLAPPPAPQRGDTLIDCTQCPEMIVLDGGQFAMGSEDAGQFEKPLGKPISIGQRFAMGKYEVTQEEWDFCVAAERCRGRRVADVANPGDKRRPVTDVSWDEAQAYIDWLNSTDVDKQRRGTYRLPTEAEWEYAARGGSTLDYSFDDPRTADADDPLCQYANGADASVGLLAGVYRNCSDGVGRETTLVGRYKPNSFGLYDMHGNVWEWVEDEWHKNHAERPETGCARGGDGQCAPAGDLGKDKIRVARGGSWRSGANALRSTSRNAFAQGHARATLGFRVARSLN